MGKIKLSIIIPAYKAEPYIYELFDCLAPQITKEVEVMVIDDGSPVPVKVTYPWIQLYRQENQGVSTARNYGIEHTTGEYIAFIDADDLVAKDYIATLLYKIDTEHFDYIELSWKSLPGKTEQYTCKLNSFKDKMTNPSACTRAFKRTFIGNVRFNTKKQSSEDENFTRQLDFKNGKRAIATEFMYFYRTNNQNSKSHRFWRGELDTQQIVYHYKHVTKDMTFLIDEIKKADETNCVWLLTEQNDLPELEKYCRVRKPHPIRGMELRGEPTPFFKQVQVPIKADVVIYLSSALQVSGINTFIYNYCSMMPKKTLVLINEHNTMFEEKLRPVARVMKNELSQQIVCNMVIVNKLTDTIPSNVVYEKSVRVVHGNRLGKSMIPADCDQTVFVSDYSRSTWGGVGEVIHNLVHVKTNELLLVSATRINTADKGKNDEHMRYLATLLNDKKIPFTWLNFSDKPLNNPPRNFINMGPRTDVYSFIKRADYLVQLSNEAFGFSLVEALMLGTAVITTNMGVLPEIGIKDGINGYVIPYDMKFDVTKLLNIPRFDYEYDNESIVEQWMNIYNQPGITRNNKALEIANRSVPLPDNMVRVRVLRSFTDKHTGKLVPRGDTVFTKERVKEILEIQKEKRISLIQVLIE